MKKVPIAQIRPLRCLPSRFFSCSPHVAGDGGRPQPYQPQESTRLNKFGTHHKLKPGVKYIYIPQKWIYAVLFAGFGFNYLAWLYLEAKKRREEGLNQKIFIPFILTDKEPISSTCSIFTLQPLSKPNNTDIYAEAWKKGIWSVEFKQPQLQISRFYTPLPTIPTEDGETANLRFLIRKEDGGEVSNYLHKLETGSLIELRGPKVEYEVPEEVDAVLFVAGGTGIAPALQIAYTLSKRRMKPNDKSVKILWANRRAEDLKLFSADPFVKSFLNLQSQNTQRDLMTNRAPRVFQGVRDIDDLGKQQAIEIHCYVDEEYTWIKQDNVRAQFSEFAARTKDLKNMLVVVSGPDGLVSYLAGPKQWRHGIQEQGELGGLMKRVIPDDCRIWKL